MKKITNGKIFALCLGDFARGLINGIITTYLLTFFIPTNSNTTLPQFFMKAALTMAIIRGIGTIIDAVTDPWVASLSDNSKAKSGSASLLCAGQLYLTGCSACLSFSRPWRVRAL